MLNSKQVPRKPRYLSEVIVCAFKRADRTTANGSMYGAHDVDARTLHGLRDVVEEPVASKNVVAVEVERCSHESGQDT